MNKSDTPKPPAIFERETDLPVLQLPMDGSRPSGDYTISSVRMGLPAGSPQSISVNLRDERRRKAMWLAVYASLLYRFSGGETDIAIPAATPEHGRFYLLISLEKDRSFRAVYDAIFEQLREPAYIHRSPMIESGFMIDCEPLPHEKQLLCWIVSDNGDGFALQVRYDASAYRESTIRRFMDAYLTIARAALADDAVNIGAIDLLSAEEYALYEKLNDTRSDYPADVTVHQYFERVVRTFPNRLAVSSAGGSYTYRSLNEQANRVAHLLLERGIRKGECVALFMERSMETIVSLLGVLKAGGAYVPVDPEYPEERISYILEDTKAKYLLTKRPHLERAAQLQANLGTVEHAVAVDADLGAYDASNPEIAVSPEDLAYVIYTSGSTGKPKGALLAHGGVVNLGVFSKRQFEITERDTLTQFASFSFDASVSELVCALFSGAHLYLLSPEERVSVEAFASAAERNRITFVPFVPTVFFNQLATVLSDEGYRKLRLVRTIMTAGEALYGEQVRVFQNKTGGSIGVYNLYGPTECTVGTTFYRIPSPIGDDWTHIPIGTPNDNYKVYVVNEDMRLCPVNVPGELLIESVGLAQGYLGQPEKTAAAFIPSPFEPGKTVYKSGDIVKLTSDGTLVYVTRRDTQVKIRGHRIEIGAVEDVMAKFPGLQDAAVVALKEPNGQLALAGFYTAKDGEAPRSSELRTFLSEKLPSYYLPKWLIRLDRMPLSPTGKIDRRQLAAYDPSSFADEPAPTSPDEQPRTEYEKLVAAAWSEALGSRTAGVEDDFFLVGGDSLSAIHVLVYLKPHCPALEIQHVFQYKTIRQMAGFMELLAKNEQIARIESGQAALETAAAREASLKVLREYPRLREYYGSSPVNDRDLSCILLTGATGYLGSHLLYELLTKSRADIVAFVRGTPGRSGRSRLRDVMKTYFGESLLLLMNERVRVVEGDLEAPDLGLPPQETERLVRQLDAIVHAAADVRHFGDARQFYKANVEATRHLLELAESKPGIQFHHISTIGVPEQLAFGGAWPSVEETNDIAPELQVDNVYTNSKLEAEKLVLAAARKGLAVSVYRPGNVTCHSLTGKFQTNIDSNAFYRMIKAMLLLGKAPEIRGYVDLTPIDYASSTIADLVLTKEAIGHMFHICNPNPIPFMELVELINRCGYRVETMEYGAFVKWLFDPAVPKSKEAMELAMTILEGDGAKDSDFVYGCETASAFLRPTSLRCAHTDLSFVQKLIAYANYVGFFPPPQRCPETAVLT
ncbi:amino acid adenylation domain-containing protein [Paenibacillus sp.]|uniref:non-ribosomal peptide synthetase family protein n=1 Tax=Paenibacillus sp. TaxID=58172 RepID=UPI002D414E1A|nr:amino acid adenylation domain-containing protein [Paenibacillus sp.]HZG86015.1 amino acid adenylation domain-containing protein [Paenibacillus sp.]